MPSTEILYSIVVPIYNDGALAREFCDELRRVMSGTLPGEPSNHFELIFVDDGSRAGEEHLAQLAVEHDFVRVVRLSRNFGQHIALSCGYAHARGRYVVILNVDMEDPPDQIPRLLKAIESEDHDIVYGLRDRRYSPLAVRMSSTAFNWVLNLLTGVNVPYNVSTLRVMNRKFVNAYNELEERSRYIPGLETWLGFRRGYVAIRTQPRTQGQSAYTFRKRLGMAVESILSFSDLPLKSVSMLGILISLVGFVMVAALIVGRLFLVDFRPGYASTIAVVVFLGGIEVVVIGMSGLYLGRVLREVQRRPLYVVAERLGFDQEDL